MILGLKGIRSFVQQKNLLVLDNWTGFFWSPAMSYLGCKDTDELVNPVVFFSTIQILIFEYDIKESQYNKICCINKSV